MLKPWRAEPYLHTRVLVSVHVQYESKNFDGHAAKDGTGVMEIRKPRIDAFARTAWISCAWVALSALGCGLMEPPAPQAFPVAIRVFSDPSTPVSGATVRAAGSEVKTVKGEAVVELRGHDGETADVIVECPAEYQSPSKPVNVTLRKLLDNKVPEYHAFCPPVARKAIIAVRAENGPDIPVVYLGREVARTNALGAAHFLLEDVHPGDRVEVTLATESRDLKPRNPTSIFTVRPRDEMHIFEQRFETPPPTAKRVRRYTRAASRVPRPL